MPRTDPARLEEAIRQRIREAGLRRTPARVAVLMRLAAAPAPMTHGELADELAERGFDQATIYRNLTELAAAGLVLRIELGDHVWRFEARDREPGPAAASHPHFLCVACGTVVCLRDVRVRVEPAPGRKGSSMRKITSVLLRGHCRRCG